jgi:hypothetical protein
MTTLHPDWLAFFESLIEARVDFLLVGGLAVGIHAEPRATDDLDVFVRPTLTNARRLRSALIAFGFGDATPSAERLAIPQRVFMIGRKPLRIDMLNAIDGVTFADAWRNRVEVLVDGVRIPVIGRKELIANKIAAGTREGPLRSRAPRTRAVPDVRPAPSHEGQAPAKSQAPPNEVRPVMPGVITPP